MKTLFFGTPEFAVPTLAALVEAGYPPDLVISQPARPVGRKRVLQDPPVAAWAREHGLEVAQPEKVNRAEFLDRLDALDADVAVVVAFGQIFRARLLALPRLGCVNLHGSLLPEYRGAAPMQAAIRDGRTETGVCTMVMEKGLDSGPVLEVVRVPIGPDDTLADLSPRLSEAGAGLMVQTLGRLAAGELTPQPQDDTKATYAPRLEKQDGQVDWWRPARRTYDQWRAFTPWPGLQTTLRGKAVKLLVGRPGAGSPPPGAAPGEILGLRDGVLEVACGAIDGGAGSVESTSDTPRVGEDGTIFAVERLQIAGKKPVSATDFANGERLGSGECFVAPAQDPPTQDPPV